MYMKKFIVLFLCIALFPASVYAASGEGYFGSDAAPDDVIPDTGSETDSYYEEGYEPINAAPAQPAQQVPVLPPLTGQTDKKQDEGISTGDLSNRTKQALGDKREKYSEDTAKVIKSYNLGASAKESLMTRHKDAEKGQGNREKVDRYEIIFRSHPDDYLAAYRLAQLNFAMGRNGQALGWVDKSLAVFPNYMPARRLRNQIEGALKR